MKPLQTVIYKMQNCSNSFGGRTHGCQIPVPNSKKFTKDRLKYIKHGPWTSLENLTFIVIIEDFKAIQKDLSRKHA